MASTLTLTAAAAEPLTAVPTRDLIALARHWLADSDGASHERLRVRTLIDLVRDSRRNLVQKFVARTTGASRANDAYSATRLAADGLSAAVLAAAEPCLTLEALARAGILAQPGDLAVLGVASVHALLETGTRPSQVADALDAAAGAGLLTSGSLTPLAELIAPAPAPALTAAAWLVDAARLSPADLAALGVRLDAWLHADAVLFLAARATANKWLLGQRCSARVWRKVAGLSEDMYARLNGSSVEKRAVTAAAPSSGLHDTWI